jgi:hypothetical protein
MSFKEWFLKLLSNDPTVSSTRFVMIYGLVVASIVTICAFIFPAKSLGLIVGAWLSLVTFAAGVKGYMSRNDGK